MWLKPLWTFFSWRPSTPEVQIIVEPAPSPLKALPRPANDDTPVPLTRVFPELPEQDQKLGEEKGNRFSQDDIAQALALLQGGQIKRRVTKPARFQIALRHVRGFSRDCLQLQASSAIRIQDMYAGYCLWISEHDQEPITESDFDYAMADWLASFGGIRSASVYSGCKWRGDFARRMHAERGREVKRRLGMGLEELMSGGIRRDG